ncbi:hypothetical protein H6G94_32365 [Nostoc punctiforme FACHB-252]|uniref:Poly A polymerase head domain-containing protein n=1 Tax=Nostoc punctiforme FACHB-252 TaxID=1357509 RepID=A0ABR8HKV2_NOSPU|nr:hypothetical protein [Nostoc punctiforme]MBD2615891.1 hypothetical protein [Nostoc punctiforme FACHB-252]
MHIPLVKVTDLSQPKIYKPVTESLRLSLIERLQWNFDQVINNDRALCDIMTALHNQSAQAVVFGGWVRDHVYSYVLKQNFQPRDIDVVVDGLDFHQLQKLLPSDNKVNIFGGFSIETSTNRIDIWLLKDTYLIKKLNFELNFDKLPQTTVFRINSIIFKPEQLWSVPDIFDFGCIDALKDKVLDFQSSFIPFPEIQVARAIVYSIKLNLKMKPEIINFIRMICNSEEVTSNITNNLLINCPPHLLTSCMNLLKKITES